MSEVCAELSDIAYGGVGGGGGASMPSSVIWTPSMRSSRSIPALRSASRFASSWSRASSASCRNRSASRRAAYSRKTEMSGSSGGGSRPLIIAACAISPSECVTQRSTAYMYDSSSTSA